MSIVLGYNGECLTRKKINTYKNLMIKKNIPKENPLGLKWFWLNFKDQRVLGLELLL